MDNVFDKIISDAASTAKQANAADGDYIGENGLLYCARCNTPKQTRVTIAGRERTFYCLCKCAAEKEDLRRKQDEREERENRRRACFGMRREMYAWTFESADVPYNPVLTTAKEYADTFKKHYDNGGDGLLFFGQIGRGKSFAAACIANKLIDDGYRVKFANASDVVATVSSIRYDRAALLESLNDCHLLIIDDLGADRKSDFARDVIYALVESRYCSGLPVVVTANMTAQEIKYPKDIEMQRIISRLYKMTVPVECDGKDLRREDLRKRLTEK